LFGRSPLPFAHPTGIALRITSRSREGFEIHPLNDALPLVLL
jgi:hypothetical protein